MIPRNGNSRWRTTCPIENLAVFIAPVVRVLEAYLAQAAP